MHVCRSVNMCVHGWACKHFDSDIFIYLFIFWSLMSFSQDTMGADPFYLFVRQPDECNWQSYYNFTKAVFYPWHWYERHC